MSTRTPAELLEAITAKERELEALRRRLAAYRDVTRLREGPIGVLRCRLGNRHVAFRQADVDEVVAMAELLTLPGSPAWLMGLLALGRERIPVLDLAARETGIRRAVDPSEHVVLARSSGRRIGLVVDALDSLATIEASEVRRPSSELAFAAHVVGAFTIDEQPTLLLSFEPLSADLPDEATAP